MLERGDIDKIQCSLIAGFFLINNPACIGMRLKEVVAPLSFRTYLEQLSNSAQVVCRVLLRVLLSISPTATTGKTQTSHDKRSLLHNTDS